MSLLFPRKNPSLPQNDTAGAQGRRKSQLFHSQQTCVWDTHNVNVGPVPMAKFVPKEASPTLT
jgi:arachidonate 15-lipoxygenase